VSVDVFCWRGTDRVSPAFQKNSILVGFIFLSFYLREPAVSRLVEEEAKYEVQMFGFPDRYLPVGIIHGLGAKHPTSPGYSRAEYASPEYASPESSGPESSGAGCSLQEWRRFFHDHPSQA
jgi:hypothetical protein